MKPLVTLIAFSTMLPLCARETGGAEGSAGWAEVQQQVAQATAAAKAAQASAEEQVYRAQQEVARALHAVGPALAGVDERVVVAGPGVHARSPVVIRYSDLAAEAQGELEEDLAVMGHILDKAVADVRGQPHRAMGIDLVFGPGKGPLRSLHLDGFGAVFVAHDRFPLLPAAGKPADEEKEADSTWDEARQELYGKAPAAKVPSEGEPYSDETVKKLKETVLDALKNASHIRQLKPEDSVTVCVLGTPGGRSVSRRSLTKRSETTSGDSKKKMVWVTGGSPQGTVLTIKVSKADVDAFAKGDLSFEAFSQKAKVMAYAGNVVPGGVGVGVFTGPPWGP
jgi:hypothetical protein